jgi:hypothetical protein
MNENRNERMQDAVREVAAEFLGREANRNRSEFSDFFKKKVKALPPHVEFIIDRGEKNRLRLEELS